MAYIIALFKYIPKRYPTVDHVFLYIFIFQINPKSVHLASYTLPKRLACSESINSS